MYGAVGVREEIYIDGGICSSSTKLNYRDVSKNFSMTAFADNIQFSISLFLFHTKFLSKPKSLTLVIVG